MSYCNILQNWNMIFTSSHHIPPLYGNFRPLFSSNISFLSGKSYSEWVQNWGNLSKTNERCFLYSWTTGKENIYLVVRRYSLGLTRELPHNKFFWKAVLRAVLKRFSYRQDYIIKDWIFIVFFFLWIEGRWFWWNYIQKRINTIIKWILVWIYLSVWLN